MNKFLKIFQIAIFFSIVSLLSVNIALAAIAKPELSVGKDVFNINFSKGCVAAEGDFCEIGWIGEYISGIYRYGVSMAVILAVVAVMVGGFVWLASGGSPDKIKTAKSIIGSAFAGLFLALFSFVILQTINPRLVNLDSLKIEVIKKIDISFTPTGSGLSCLDKSSEADCKIFLELDNVGSVDYQVGKSCSNIAICGSTAPQTDNCCIVRLKLFENSENCQRDDQCQSGVCNQYFSDRCSLKLQNGEVGCKRGFECLSGYCETSITWEEVFNHCAEGS